MVSTTIELDAGQPFEDMMQRLHALGVPDAEIHVQRASQPRQEVTERDMADSIRLGVIVGLPTAYIATVCLALLAGISLADSALIAVLPAFTAGWFLAGFAFLNVRVARIETATHIIPEREVDAVSVDGPHAAQAKAMFDEVRAAASVSGG